MKLVNIWNARESFSRLAALKKPPKLAYRLMRWGKKFSSEFDTCDTQRGKYVCEVAGVEFGSVEAAGVVLSIESPEFATFAAKFNEFLMEESALEQVDVTMDDLIDGLDAEKGNALSEVDLALLEPFFKT